jgi:hypothetical protein
MFCSRSPNLFRWWSLVLLVRLDYGGLCSLLVFVCFLWLAGKHFREASKGEIPPFLWLAVVLVGFQFFHFFRPDLRCSTAPSRHAPPCCAHRRPLVQTLPSTAGLLSGDRRVVSTRQGALHTLAARDEHVSCLCRAGWCPGIFLL